MTFAPALRSPRTASGGCCPSRRLEALLFDQNLAPRLVARLADIFPASEHVRDVGLATGDDHAVWSTRSPAVRDSVEGRRLPQRAISSGLAVESTERRRTGQRSRRVIPSTTVTRTRTVAPRRAREAVSAR
jgi:hypothetical protein